MCEDDNHKVYNTEIFSDSSRVSNQRSLNRHTNSITLHMGIMGTTTFSVGKGMAVCLPSQTQAAIVDVTDPKQTPKS